VQLVVLEAHRYFLAGEDSDGFAKSGRNPDLPVLAYLVFLSSFQLSASRPQIYFALPGSGKGGLLFG